MRRLVELSAVLDTFITDQGWSGCIIGAVANLRWGEPRLTRDVDATIITGCGGEDAYIEDLVVLKAFAPRDRDWVDIAGIAARQGPALDCEAVVKRLTPLVDLKEEPEILVKLGRLREQQQDRELGWSR
ncbi:MAG TPA: hypothetical protein VFZ73_12360 [Gemmatimonadaceae bacterium]